MTGKTLDNRMDSLWRKSWFVSVFMLIFPLVFFICPVHGSTPSEQTLLLPPAGWSERTVYHMTFHLPDDWLAVGRGEERGQLGGFIRMREGRELSPDNPFQAVDYFLMLERGEKEIEAREEELISELADQGQLHQTIEGLQVGGREAVAYWTSLPGSSEHDEITLQAVFLRPDSAGDLPMMMLFGFAKETEEEREHLIETVLNSVTFHPFPYPLNASLGTRDDEETLDGPSGLASDDMGNLYVVDRGNHRILVYDSAGSILRQWGQQGNDPGELFYPEDIALDRDGFVFITDWNNRVQKFDSSGNLILQWGRKGEGEGEFNNPRGIAVDQAGHVYVTDTGNYRIQKFTDQGDFLTAWGTFGDGPGEFAFSNLSLAGLAVNQKGEVYVSDAGNDRIQIFDPDGRYLGSLYRAETHGDVFLTLDFESDPPYFTPAGLAFDHEGNLFVADDWSPSIVKFDPALQLRQVWSRLEIPTGSGLLVRGLEYLRSVEGVAVDRTGNVSVSHALHPYLVLRFQPSAREAPSPWSNKEPANSPADNERSLSVPSITPAAEPSRSLRVVAIEAHEADFPEPPAEEEKPLRILSVEPGDRPARPSAALQVISIEPRNSSPSTSPAPENVPALNSESIEIEVREPEFDPVLLLDPPELPKVLTGKPVQFSVRLLYQPVPITNLKYRWSFGDETEPFETEDQTVTHVFQTSGSFDITVQAYDADTGQMMAMVMISTQAVTPGSDLLTHREYHPTGQPRIEYTYYIDPEGNRVKHGTETIWFEDGLRRVEGTYEDGQRQGIWTSWYDNGSIGQSGPYLDDVRHGTWTVYYRNGNKESEGPYRNNLREGTWTKWYEDGREHAELVYQNGTIVEYREIE